MMLLLWGNGGYAKEIVSYTEKNYIAFANRDLTGSAVLSNFKITREDGSEVTTAGGSNSSANYVYLYAFDWDLSNLGGNVGEGDYFTFSLPNGILATYTQSVNIIANGVVVGTASTERNNPVVRVSFNDNAQNMANYRGRISVPISVPLNEGDNTFTNPDGTETIIVYTKREEPTQPGEVRGEVLGKQGFSIYTNYIEWYIHINRSAQDFGTANVIIEDKVQTESGSFVSLIYNPSEYRWLGKENTFYLQEVVYSDVNNADKYQSTGVNHSEVVNLNGGTFEIKTNIIRVTLDKQEYDAEIASGNRYIAYAEVLDGGQRFRLHLGNNVGTRSFQLRYRTSLPDDDTKVTNSATLFVDGKATLPYDNKNGEDPKDTDVSSTPDIYRNLSTITYADVKDRIIITKYDVDNGTRLAGATFEVRNSSNVVVATLTTGNNGTIQSGILNAGTYTLREITAPDGYTLLRSPIVVEVVYNKPTFVNVANKKASAQTHCVRPANTAGTGLNTIVGITTLGRAEGKGNITDDTQWPMLRKGGWIALESNTKGFVVTRMNTNEIKALTAQEGMMVFDTDAKCLKIYDGTDWACFSTPACPTN